jgi:hypothetical protein
MSKFKTKEEYLNYISGWKSATNAEEAKSKRIVCDHKQYNWSYSGWGSEELARFEELGYKNIEKYSYVIPDGGHCKMAGWLNAEHYIFHNMMRDKDPKRGFSPKSKRKLQYPETPWYGFVSAAFQLEMIVKDAELYIDHVGKGKGSKWSMAGNRVKAFLVPFGGKVTLSDLIKINREELANARKFHR